LSKISKSQPAEERPLGAQEIAARVYVSNPSATAMEATLSIQLPDGWRSDLPEGIRVDAPAKKSWCRAFRIVHPANAQGTAYPVVAKLSFPGGACLEVRQEVRPTKRMSLGMIAKPPVLDGKLNDECWKASAPVEGFVLNDGSGLAKAQTRAWMCRDASNLYVAFECLEPAMKQLKADVKDRDGQVWTDDCVEVFIEPGPKPTSNLYHFVFNTLDVLRDEGQSGGAWNSHAKSKTLKGKDRWVIEISIPFVDLDRAPKPDDTWLVNLNRSRQAKPGSDREFSCWSCTFGPFATPERFGELTFEK
jgi:hypothetical protein